MKYVWTLAASLILIGQISAANPLPTVTAYENILVFAGPSETFRQVGRLNAGIEATIVERNRSGIWVRVQRADDQGTVVLDGWVISGYLNRDADLLFSQIPVSEGIAEADPSTVDSQSMGQLYARPVIPTISDSMVDVYEQGQYLGNDPQSVTKVGDSLSASSLYLNLFSQDDYVLGPYDYLRGTLLYYGKSTASESVAARIGMTTYTIFDPMWADKTLCNPGETPLDCEFRLKNPSVAFILFGPNDVRHMKEDQYAAQMRLMIEESLQRGIIPVLATFSAHPDEQFFWQSINFNLQLLNLSDEYQIPLVNLWAAARILPDYGLDQDDIHLKNSGFTFLKYDTGHEAFYGVSLHNLLSLVTLDEIRRKLEVR